MLKPFFGHKPFHPKNKSILKRKPIINSRFLNGHGCQSIVSPCDETQKNQISMKFNKNSNRDETQKLKKVTKLKTISNCDKTHELKF